MFLAGIQQSNQLSRNRQPGCPMETFGHDKVVVQTNTHTKLSIFVFFVDYIFSGSEVSLYPTLRTVMMISTSGAASRNLARSRLITASTTRKSS